MKSKQVRVVELDEIKQRAREQVCGCEFAFEQAKERANASSGVVDSRGYCCCVFTHLYTTCKIDSINGFYCHKMSISHDINQCLCCRIKNQRIRNSVK